jgi:hypothetical protein
MRLEIRDANGKVLGIWVAKTSRGFNAKQKQQIAKVRGAN